MVHNYPHDLHRFLPQTYKTPPPYIQHLLSDGNGIVHFREIPQDQLGQLLRFCLPADNNLFLRRCKICPKQLHRSHAIPEFHTTDDRPAGKILNLQHNLIDKYNVYIHKFSTNNEA